MENKDLEARLLLIEAAIEWTVRLLPAPNALDRLLLELRGIAQLPEQRAALEDWERRIRVPKA